MANLMPWSSGQGSRKEDLDSILCQPQVSCYQSSLQSQLLFNLFASIPLLCKTGVSAFFHFWACWAQNYEDNVLHSGWVSTRTWRGKIYKPQRQNSSPLPTKNETSLFLTFAYHFRTFLCSCAGSRHCLQLSEPNSSISLTFLFPPRPHNIPLIPAPNFCTVKFSL